MTAAGQAGKDDSRGAYSADETSAPEKLNGGSNVSEMRGPCLWAGAFHPNWHKPKIRVYSVCCLRHSRCCCRDISNGGYTSSSRVYRRQIDAHCKGARRM